MKWQLALVFAVNFVLASVPLSAQEMQETRYGQSCWILKSSTVELAVTREGGHMAPVTFARQSQTPVRPYYVSPWQEEQRELDVPVLRPLRGDFFCMPFGGNSEEYRGEKHPPHGEVAGSPWKFVSIESGKTADGTPLQTLTLSMETTVRKGRVTKKIMLVDGEDVVYTQHIVEGFVGPTPIAHHATLAMPDEPRAVEVRVSPFQFGMTNPGVFSDPAKREYQSLAIRARFNDLKAVPSIWKHPETVDLTAFPDRTGFADLIGLVNQPDASRPGWVTAYNKQTRSAWFSLKDVSVLPMTVFWIENHGRHSNPWNGRNQCLGLEDVCAYFADGLVPSIEANPLSQAGIKTAHEIVAGKPLVVNYIQGAFPADEGIEELDFEPGQLVVKLTNGHSKRHPVRHEFLKSGKL